MQKITSVNLYVPSETGINLLLHPLRVANNYVVYDLLKLPKLESKTHHAALRIFAGFIALTIWLIPTLIGLAYQRFSKIHQDHYKKALEIADQAIKEQKEVITPRSVPAVTLKRNGTKGVVATSAAVNTLVAKTKSQLHSKQRKQCDYFIAPNPLSPETQIAEAVRKLQDETKRNPFTSVYLPADLQELDLSALSTVAFDDEIGEWIKTFLERVLTSECKIKNIVLNLPSNPLFLPCFSFLPAAKELEKADVPLLYHTIRESNPKLLLLILKNAACPKNIKISFDCPFPRSTNILALFTSEDSLSLYNRLSKTDQKTLIENSLRFINENNQKCNIHGSNPLEQISSRLDSIFATMDFEEMLPLLEQLPKTNRGYMFDKSLSDERIKVYVEQCYKACNSEERSRKLTDLFKLFSRLYNFDITQNYQSPEYLVKHKVLIEQIVAHAADIEAIDASFESYSTYTSHPSLVGFFIHALSEQQIKQYGMKLKAHLDTGARDDYYRALIMKFIRCFSVNDDNSSEVDFPFGFARKVNEAEVKNNLEKMTAFLNGLNIDPLEIMQNLPAPAHVSPEEVSILCLVKIHEMLPRIKKLISQLPTLFAKNLTQVLSESEKEILAKGIEFWTLLRTGYKYAEGNEKAIPNLGRALASLYQDSDEIKTILEIFTSLELTRSPPHQSRNFILSHLRTIFETENEARIVRVFKAFWSYYNRFDTKDVKEHLTLYIGDIARDRNYTNSVIENVKYYERIMQIVLLTLPSRLPEENFSKEVIERIQQGVEYIPPPYSTCRLITTSANALLKRLINPYHYANPNNVYRPTPVVSAEHMKQLWEQLFTLLPSLDNEVMQMTLLPKAVVEQIITQYVYSWRSSAGEEPTLFEEQLSQKQLEKEMAAHTPNNIAELFHP